MRCADSRVSRTPGQSPLRHPAHLVEDANEYEGFAMDYGGLPFGDDRASATTPSTINATPAKIVGMWNTVTLSEPYAHRKVDSERSENTNTKPAAPSNDAPSVRRSLGF